MCDICDGRTEQELFESMRDRIADHQWVLQAVESGTHSAGWVYTIGLMASYGAPELVISGDDMRHDAMLLDEIGDRIRRGAHVDAGLTLDLDGYPVEFEVVHPSYIEHGLLACWHDYYWRMGEEPGPLRALQVVPPLTEWCDHCDRKRRCLATPGARGFGGGLNRGQRRARSRRNGRH
jgi:hypothetical protein